MSTALTSKKKESASETCAEGDIIPTFAHGTVMQGALDKDALDCIPHPNAVTQQDGGDYKNYMQSDKGKHPLPFAMAEKIDNSIKAIMSATRAGERVKGLIEVQMLFDDDGCNHIVFLDNGCGMTRDDLRAYGTYSYSQQARQQDAANHGIGPAKSRSTPGAAAASACEQSEGDPLVLTGNIGHFGVGAQHSTFFMGNMEQVMSRAIGARGKTPIEDMLISEGQMHHKWRVNEKTEVYKFPILARAAGDGSAQHTLDDAEAREQLATLQKHPAIKALIREEQNRESFCMLAVSGVRARNELGKGSNATTKIDELVQDAARIYNYYLHGTDDAELPTGSDTDSDSDSDEDDVAAFHGGVGKRAASGSGPARGGKRRKGNGGSAGGGEGRGGAERRDGGVIGGQGKTSLLQDIDIRFVVVDKDGHRGRVRDLRDERSNIEFLMRRKAADRFAFNMRLVASKPGEDMLKVTVRLYYFPKLMDKETRPLDRYERRDPDDMYAHARTHARARTHTCKH